MSEPDPQLLNDVTMTIKCLKCKNTYDEEGITLDIALVVDPDTGVFVQYDVQFSHVDGTLAFIQDLLCVGDNKGFKRCSVFGRVPDGSVFAFPHLLMGRNHVTWHSKPDSNGDHFAMRRRKRVGL